VAHNATINLRMGVTPWLKGTDPVLQFDRARTACNKVRGSEKHLMVYDNELQKQEQLNQRLINDLGKGIQEHEFKVFYQPKYSIQNGAPKLASAEALIRWQHPELGLIPPDAFIPLFERNGQIREIDKYVWNEAAKQIDTWKQKYGITLPVSVNLSRVDALDPNLEQTLDDLVAKYKLERKFLNLEITESAYTENADQLRDTIYRLREKGFVIEMDDFGSGYSSLNMLKDLPVNVLKIDLRFLADSQGVENGRADNILDSIVRMAKRLDLLVIAEGVETQKQVDFLRLIGCEYVQGYFFSEPVPGEHYQELIKNDYVVEHKEPLYSEHGGGTVLTLSSQLSMLMEELREIAPDKIAAIEEKMKEEAAALW
jgi:EAL domain-containing protein (putative c-di-GMP-specific phosphodiesterase class I)